MTKFNKGDQVVVLESISPRKTKFIGQVGKIKITSVLAHIVEIEGRPQAFWSHELRKLTPLELLAREA